MAVASGEGSAHDPTPLGWRTAGEQWPVNLEEVACGEWWSVPREQWPVAGEIEEAETTVIKKRQNEANLPMVLTIGRL